MTQNGLARPTKVSATADKQVTDAAANRDSAIDTDGVVGCVRGQNPLTEGPQHKTKTTSKNSQWLSPLNVPQTMG